MWQAAAPAAAAAWCAPALAPVMAPASRRLGIATRLRDSGGVGITFDDGPHPQGTPAVLETLRAHGVRATFFVVGEQVRRTGSLAAEMAAAGHALAIHGDRHRCLLRIAPAALRDDLDRAAETVAAATGERPSVHRAPYGVYSWPALRELRRRSWTPVLWSAWGRDWRRGATPAGIAALVLRDLDGGGIALLHDADDYSAPGSWRATAAALPRILDAIGERGLRAVALDRAGSAHVPGR